MLRRNGMFELESVRSLILEPIGQLSVVGHEAGIGGEAVSTLGAIGPAQV